MRITWTPPTRVRDGTKVRVLVWEGASCGKEPNSVALRVSLDPGKGEWTDREYGLGSWCYLLRIENRYGGARPDITKSMERYAPIPQAPDVGRS